MYRKASVGCVIYWKAKADAVADQHWRVEAVAVVAIAMLIRIHTFLSHVRPCRCATQITEDVLMRSMLDPTFGFINEHELMMLVCAVKFYIISDKLIAIMLVIGFTALTILVNTTNDPTLITNHNLPAVIDTIIVVDLKCQV